MATKIFVSLPVKNLQKSIEFYLKLGYTINPQFASETATCMIISEDIYAMLGTHATLKSLTQKEICDTTKYTSALISLSCESRAQVDELVAKAIAAGGSTSSEPTDHGFMYSHDYEDLDGNGWGLFWMDPNHVQ
jgi:hypothetical protein